MENTLFCIFICHKKSFSLFRFLFFITPNWIFMIFIFLLTNHLIFIYFVSIRVGVKSLIVEILRITFGRNPRMTFGLLVSLFCKWIDLLLKSEKFILQKFWTFFISRHNSKIFRHKLFVIFDCIFKNIIEKLS